MVPARAKRAPSPRSGVGTVSSRRRHPNAPCRLWSDISWTRGWRRRSLLFVGGRRRSPKPGQPNFRSESLRGHGNDRPQHLLATHLPGVRAGHRWRRRVRGSHHRPHHAHDQPATRPEAVAVDHHRHGSRWPAGLGQHERRNALAPAGHGPPDRTLAGAAPHGIVVSARRRLAGRVDGRLTGSLELAATSSRVHWSQARLLWRLPRARRFAGRSLTCGRGGRGRGRTCNPPLRRLVLYPLSYARVRPALAVLEEHRDREHRRPKPKPPPIIAYEPQPISPRSSLKPTPASSCRRRPPGEVSGSPIMGTPLFTLTFRCASSMAGRARTCNPRRLVLYSLSYAPDAAFHLVL